MTQRCILYGHSPKTIRDIAGIRGYDLAVCENCNMILKGDAPSQFKSEPVPYAWNHNAPVVEMEIQG